MPITRSLAGLVLIVGTQARADDPAKFDPAAIEQQLELASSRFLEAKDDPLLVKADLEELKAMARTAALRNLFAAPDQPGKPESASEIGQIVARAWEENRGPRGRRFKDFKDLDHFKTVTFRDIKEEIENLVRVRFETEPKAKIYIDDVEVGEAPVIRFLSKKGVYKLEVKANGYETYLNKAYSPGTGGVNKLKLTKK